MKRPEHKFVEVGDDMFTGGFRIDLERFNYYRQLPAFPLEKIRKMRTWETPEQVDPRPWLQVENQGSVGSCQGHSLTTSIEVAYNIEAEEIIQLNRNYAYRKSQLMDNINGDSGSTCSGGVRVGKEFGLPLEEEWPYNGTYQSRIPSGLDEKAKPYRIKSAVKLRNYAEMFEFLASGIGSIHIGIPWVVPDRAVVESVGSGGGGGHSVSMPGYTTRKDSSGKNYILLVNSWGERWGDGGWCELSPRAVEQMCRLQWSEFFGISDMVEIEPRRINHRFM